MTKHVKVLTITFKATKDADLFGQVLRLIGELPHTIEEFDVPGQIDVRQELNNYATTYDFGKYKIVFKGNSWAVMDEYEHLCYNKLTDKFIFEPMPSNRDEKFFNACRFELLEAKNVIDKLNKKDKQVK